MTFSRRALALFAALTAGAVLTACGGSGGADAGDGPVVVATTESAVEDVTPGQSDASNVDYALFTPLTRYDATTKKLENAVAASLESTDQVHWTVKLQQGWTFHDGSPVTARSFVDSWNVTADPANAMDNNGLMSVFAGYDAMNPAQGEPTATSLSGVKATDDLTLDITLATPNRLLPFVLSSSAFSPMTTRAAKDPKAFATKPVGNGPFRAAQGGWRTGDQDITLQRYDDYRGEKAGLDEVDLRVYTADANPVTDWESGQVDLTFVDGSDLDTVEQQDPDQVVDVTLPALIYLGFPLYDERFEDVQVRRAFSLAIDRESIAKNLLKGRATAATGLSPDVLVGADDVRCPTCEYDPDAAKAALRAAGGFEGPLVLQTYTEPANEKILQAVANQLEKNLGIETTIKSQPISQLYDSLRADDAQGPFLLYSGAPYPHVFAQARGLMSRTGTLNVTTFDDAQFEAALATAAAASTDDEAATDAAKAAEVGLGKVPITPLVYPTAGIATSERVEGVTPEFLGGPRLASIQRR